MRKDPQNKTGNSQTCRSLASRPLSLSEAVVLRAARRVSGDAVTSPLLVCMKVNSADLIEIRVDRRDATLRKSKHCGVQMKTRPVCCWTLSLKRPQKLFTELFL